MSQASFSVANADGATVRASINANLQALASLSAGTSAPSTTYAGMYWLDTTNHLLKRRNEANNAWITVAKFDETNALTSPYAWNAVLDDAFEDLASASTTNLATPVSRNVRITGTTTITAFGTVKSGSIRHIRFAGALTLTHNGTSLILPGSANITTAADDTATVVSLGSGNWLCLDYKKASGLPVVAPTVTGTLTAGTNAVLNPYATSGAVTQAHGLGVMPALVDIYLENLTTELGYSVGDRVPLFFNDNGSALGCVAVTKNSTNVIITTRSAGLPIVINRSTNAGATITAANWKLVAVPYKLS